MPKIATGAKQLLSDDLVRVAWSGLSANDELELRLDEAVYSLSTLELDPKLLNFMRQPRLDVNEYQISLDKVSKEVKMLNFVLNSNSHGPFAWSLEGNQTTESFQSDSIAVGMNRSCYLLRLTRAGEKWQVENVNIPVLASGTIGIPSYQIPEEIRDVALYAAYRDLAKDRLHFSTLIDLTASMSPWLQHNAHLSCVSAVTAISATVTKKYPSVSLNGLKVLDIEPGKAGLGQLQDEIRTLTSQNLRSLPLHSLIPKLTAELPPKSVLFVVSDEVPVIKQETVNQLEQRDVELNLLLLGNDAIIPRLPQSKKLVVSRLGDIEPNTPVESILDSIA